MDADRAIDLTAPPEEMTEREVRLQRVIVDLGHAHEQLQRFVCLPIQNEIQASQIVGVDRGWRWFAAISARIVGEAPTRGCSHDE